MGIYSKFSLEVLIGSATLIEMTDNNTQSIIG